LKLIPAFFAACLMLAASAPAKAHPHAWIDIRSGLVFDETGHIVAIEEEWFFDTLYSAVIQEELGSDGRPIEDLLDELAQINLTSLAAYDYFTTMLADGSDVAVGEVVDYATGMREGRLWLKFWVPLTVPVDPHAQAVSYAIYDPSYYIEMVHMKGEPIMLSGERTEGCTALAVAAEPTFDAVALAAALDQTQTGPADLGALFAEWVEVRCE
jgi:ABC-type uncharacterized transport system substrate-binding protein